MLDDKSCIRRCIELARKSISEGENPFGSIIAGKNDILAESINKTVSYSDISAHAEIIAMRSACEIMKKNDLSECTLYSICEPCPMCSFMARELKIRRVVFSLSSPFMGGFTKWHILDDDELEMFRPVFAHKPEILSGLLKEEAIQIYHDIGWGAMFERYV